jgi:hypothetical protein
MSFDMNVIFMWLYVYNSCLAHAVGRIVAADTVYHLVRVFIIIAIFFHPEPAKIGHAGISETT